MKYPYSAQLFREEDGECCWVARSECLKGCIGTGETPEEAVNELEENENAWLETAMEYGIEIPAVPYEREESFSGKFTVRVSPRVHREASEQAKKQGISLNQYVNDAIVSYNAEEKAAGYISETVAAMAQDIGKRSLRGTSYSEFANVPSQLYTRSELRYKQ